MRFENMNWYQNSLTQDDLIPHRASSSWSDL